MNAELLTILVGTLLMGVLVAFIISFVVQYRKTQLRFQLERQQFQQALLETQMEIREQTLTDLSRDLHDNFGQIASLIKINLNMLSEVNNEHDQEHIGESKKLLKQLIEDMRSLSHSLNPANLKEKGLARMIENDVERVNKSGFVNVDLQTEAPQKELKPEITVFLYRMFQEMLNNILKHSQADEARVKLKSTEDQLVLEVSDNGIGFDPGDPKKQISSGLSNIRDRCKMIGAHASIDSSPGKGTFIKISLPL